MEVVATTHATPGVRQLVKAVIRGLKACQVGTCPAYSSCCHLFPIIMRMYALSYIISPCRQWQPALLLETKTLLHAGLQHRMCEVSQPILPIAPSFHKQPRV